jgi:two-component system sensor histidine kinase BaeS
VTGSPLNSHLGRRLLATFLAVSLAAIALVTAAAVVGTGRGFDVLAEDQRRQAAADVAAEVARAYRQAGGWSGIDLAAAQQAAQAAGARLMVFPSGQPGGAGGPGMGRGGESAPVVVAGATVGSIRLAFGSPATSARDVAWTWIAVAALIAVVLAVVASWYASARLVRPLHSAAQVARRFGSGDRSARIGDLGPGELGDLGRAIDDMAAKVAAVEDQRRRAAADVAHELRTPVASLQAGLEELRDGYVQADGATLDGLHDQTLRLGRIVDDLAALAAVESGTLRLAPDRCDLAALAATEVQAQLPAARAAGISVSTELPPVHLVADADRIRQVVRNLVANAIRYSRAGDGVTVTVRAGDHAAVLTVSDTGPGILAADLPHVFDRLYRGRSGDRAAAGSGIGLAVVHELVSAHGGSVSVDSDGRSGTTVTVTLPRPAGPVEPHSTRPSVASP